jgi:hypothetical protein
MPKIQKKILDVMPDILHLQEIRKVNWNNIEIDSLTPIKHFLTDNGYGVVLHQYNPSDVAFIYITAYKLDRFCIQDENYANDHFK